MIQHAFLIIHDDGHEQVFALKDVEEGQRTWLEMLAKSIPGSEISDTPVVLNGDNGIHYGIMDFITLRSFLRELGYADALDLADASYRNLCKRLTPTTRRSRTVGEQALVRV